MKDRKKIQRKIQRIVIPLLVFVIIPFILFLLITSRSPVLFGMRSFIVVTGSMEPALPVGSMLLTFPSSQYKEADIITFTRDGKEVTHRVFREANGEYETKGDMETLMDMGTVKKRDIIGKVIISIPLLGSFIQFIKTVPGFILFVALPIAVFIGFEIATIKTEWEKHLKQKVIKEMNAENNE